MQDFRPHGYQQRGIQWILDHKSCGLFLPMGAGKTATTLLALDQLMNDRFEINRVLIIGPKRVIETTWPDEIQKWSQTKDFRFSVISGTASQRKEAVSKDADIYLIGKENVVWLVDLIGKHWKWDMVIIDELSTFKNHQAKRFKALRTVIPAAKRFVGLTGTPSPKGIPDLWAQIYLMDRGERLGRTIGSFRSQYLKPGRMNGYTVYNWQVQPDAEEKIHKKISDICMSIDEKEYATLPDLQIIDQMVDLKTDLKKYKAFKREMVLDLAGDEQVLASNAGALCGKLLQYTSGQIYTEEGQTADIHSHKLEALESLMESANGQPMLVFYWFKHEEERLMNFLTSKHYKGKTIKEKNAIQDWNDGQLDFLLLQPSSAGHGLNLQQGGHLACWYSLPNWNLELYQQANARIYRQGQKEKVVIYHLLAKGTIDQDMLQALQTKRVTQDELLKALRI